MMDPVEVEKYRIALRAVCDEAAIDQLCELALDGFRFRAFIDANVKERSVARLSSLLVICQTPEEFREAIADFVAMVEREQKRAP